MDSLLSKERAMAALPLLDLIAPEHRVIEFGANRYVTPHVARKFSESATVDWDAHRIVDVQGVLGNPSPGHRFVHLPGGASSIPSMGINQYADAYLINMMGFDNADLVNAAIAREVSGFEGNPLVIVFNHDNLMVQRSCAQNFQHVREHRAPSGFSYAICTNAEQMLNLHINNDRLKPEYRVGVYVCTRDGNPSGKTMESVRREAGLHHGVHVMVGGYSVANVRNNAVNHFLAMTYDAMLFVDDTVIIPEGTVDALYNCQGDVIAAPVPTFNNIMGFSVPVVTVKKGDLDLWHLTWPAPEQFKIAMCGMACTMIRRHVFDKMAYPFFVWPLDHELRPSVRSEDCQFCVRARENNFEIWCDGRVRCSHYKEADAAALIPGYGEKVSRKTWKGPTIAREHVLRQENEAAASPAVV